MIDKNTKIVLSKGMYLHYHHDKGRPYHKCLEHGDCKLWSSNMWLDRSYPVLTSFDDLRDKGIFTPEDLEKIYTFIPEVLWLPRL